jgi:hypothetical protein
LFTYSVTLEKEESRVSGSRISDWLGEVGIELLSQ